MDLTRWRTPGEDLPRNMVKSQKGFWPLQGPCTEVSSLDGNFIKPELNFLRPCRLTPRNGLWWSRPAVTTAGRGDDSLRLSRNTRVLQPILVCIYFPWLLVLAKERCYTWKMRLLHPQKMTNKSCQVLKGKKESTAPLSTSKGQKLGSLKTNQKQAGRNYCQIFSGQWTAKELPKNKSPGLERETGGRQKIPGKPGRCYFHGFQLLTTCSLLDTSWWTDIFQAADVILLTGLLYLKLNLAELVNNSAQRTRMQNTSSQHEEHRSWASPMERLFLPRVCAQGTFSGGELRQGWKPACSQRWAGILMISVSFVNCYKTLETPGSLKMKRK